MVIHARVIVGVTRPRYAQAHSLNVIGNEPSGIVGTGLGPTISMKQICVRGHVGQITESHQGMR